MTITSAVVFAFQKDSDVKMNMTLEEASWLRKRKSIIDKLNNRTFLSTEQEGFKFITLFLN